VSLLNLEWGFFGCPILFKPWRSILYNRKVVINKALQACGVDNWEDYDIAMEQLDDEE